MRRKTSSTVPLVSWSPRHVTDCSIEAPIRKVCHETSNTQFVAFPVLLGYAYTLVTSGLALWPDLGVPAGGYVPVTRVRAPEQLFWLTRPERKISCRPDERMLSFPTMRHWAHARMRQCLVPQSFASWFRNKKTHITSMLHSVHMCVTCDLNLRT